MSRKRAVKTEGEAYRPAKRVKQEPTSGPTYSEESEQAKTNATTSHAEPM